MKTLRPTFPALLLAVFLGSCAGESGPSLDLAVEEIPSPTRGWSGQPHLAASDSGPVLSWLETRASASGRETTLLVDRWTGDGWEGHHLVAEGPNLLVNWADFPAVSPVGDGTLAAHWLVRGSGSGEDYSLRIGLSEDGGRTWTDPWIPHEDRSGVAHGFATAFPLEGSFGVIWLDGRGQPGVDHSPDASAPDVGEVSLWVREVPLSTGTDAPAPPAEVAGPESLLDDRTCECCQTDVALGAEGPILVYRDRTPEEVRDIHVMRRIDGEWESAGPVHEDGWVFPACPINGPAIDARDGSVAVAWFTAAEDAPRVRLAFSSDGGRTFDDPVRIDDGNPSGRTDVVLLRGGTALVSWLERVEGGAEVRVRRIAPSGGRSEGVRIAETGGGQASGFPQMVAGPAGSLLFAWTDSRSGESRVRVAQGILAGSEDPATGAGGGSS